MKDGTALALGVVGVVAAASAFARHGSRNAPTVSQLQQRMLRVWNQYPERVAWFAQQVVDATLFSQADSYIRTGDGWDRFQQDMTDLGVVGGASSFYRDAIKKNRHWLERDYPSTHPIEPLIPWIAKEVNRIVKRLPPITIRESDLGYGRPRKEFEVSVEDVRRLIETRAQGQASKFVFASGVSLDVPRSAHTSISLGPIPVSMETKSAEDVVVAWHISKLRHALPSILDWYSSGEAGDLMPLTYEQAIKGEKKWHRALAAAAPARGQRATTQGTTVITMASPRGWTIRELSPSDLRPQSEAMGHCVGKSDTYRNLITRGEGKIYSVRDEQGRSVFTVEVRFNPDRIVQFKGDGNRVPGLNKRKTGELPSKFEPGDNTWWFSEADDIPYSPRVRAWIDRAKKPFVLRDDAEAAASAARELQIIYPGLKWREDGDLVVPIALGMLG